MNVVVIVLIALAAGAATTGAALAFPWAYSLATGLIGGLWLALAVWRPASRLHALPMLLGVGVCAFLAVPVETRFLGAAGVPLALLAWDASFTVRAMRRFTKAVSPAVVLRYAAAVAAIAAASMGLAIGAELLPLRLGFPAALGVSIVLLGLGIGVLAVARRSASGVTPLENQAEEEEGDDVREDASPTYQPRGLRP